MLPQSFGQNPTVGEEGEVDDSDASQLAGLPYVFDETGELQHFLVNLQGHVATAADFQQDAEAYEKCMARNTRFIQNHCHDHECSVTCVKNVKKKTEVEKAKLLRQNKVPPCRFDFLHVVTLIINEVSKKYSPKF